MPFRSALLTFMFFLIGCTHIHSGHYPSVDQFPPGIFLEPEVDNRLELEREAAPLPFKGLELTKRSEGFRSHLYNDAVMYCTIGYGHLVKKFPCDGTESVGFLRGLSREQGSQLLTQDMNRVRQSVTAFVHVEMTSGQYGALCDFVFNVGATNFSNSTLLRVINARQNDRIPAQFRRWILANGTELEALKARREREIRLYFSGFPVPTTREEAGAAPIDIRKGEK
jgi:GH24 family phage-related lysozyme (muramidase)